MKIQTVNKQSGFSVMELIVAMTIMLIVFATVFSLLRGSIITANADYELTDAQQSLRNAHEFINRDLLTTGDGLKGVANFWLTTDFTTKYITNRTVTEVDPSNVGYAKLSLVYSDNNMPAGVVIADTTPATSIKANTDRLTILSVDRKFAPKDLAVWTSNYNTGQFWMPAGDVSDFSVGEIYYLTNGTDATFGTVTNVDAGSGTITWGDTDSYKLNRLGWNGSMATVTKWGSQPTTMMRVNIIQYFMEDSGKLIRRVFGVQGNGHSDSVIAEHLVSLHFKYILNPSSNGSEIFMQPLEILNSEAERAAVRMVEPLIAVETAYPLQDGVKHQVEGQTKIALRNLQFSEAPIPRDSAGNTNLPPPGPTPFVTPTPTPTPIPTPTPTPTATPTPPPPTPTPTGTPTPAPTPTPTAPPPTPTPTAPPPTPTPTPTPTDIDG